MKFFPHPRFDHGSILYDNGNTITSDPLREKLNAIKRMKQSKGVSRIFAPKITAADLEQHTNQNNNDDILREE